ncbi:MAG: hypothetical protein ACRYG2_07650, partial [Janthinobacterium lividum]
LELTFSTKNADPPPGVRVAAERLFSTFGSLFDADFQAGRLSHPDLDRTKLLFVAMLQGAAVMIASGRIFEEQGTDLVDDAVDLLVAEGS